MRSDVVLLATRNRGKVRELKPMFAAAGFHLVDLDELDMEESPEEADLEQFPTFEENALAKARYFYEVSGGIATVADDSGLEVAALGGRPGVRSKRYSGRADLSGAGLDRVNLEALLAELHGVADRSARFVCAAAFIDRSSEVVRRGEVEGRILTAPVGAHGFGYDPVFFSPELGATFGERPESEKERISHRGRAFRALIAEVRGGR